MHFFFPFPIHHHHYLHSLHLFSFIFSLIFNFLFLITSLSDVRFLIRLILWITHSTNFMETTPDNQIHYFLLHIFLRILLGLMKESLYFLWHDYIFTGVLRLVMRLVFWFLWFYSAIFHICLGLIYLHAIKSKQNHLKIDWKLKNAWKYVCTSDFTPGIPIWNSYFRSALWIADQKTRILIGILDFQSKIQFSD